MKIPVILIFSAILLMTVSSLQAGEVILFAGSQKPGTITFTTEDLELPAVFLEGGTGGTFGIRLSGGKIFGMEQNISFTPRFGRGGVHAFQMDTNLVLQAPGKIAPYATGGLGFITTWGQNYPTDLDPAKIAAYAFNIGNKFSLNYGMGIKIRRLMGPMGLNFDVRGYYIPDARESSLNVVQMSLGAVFTW